MQTLNEVRHNFGVFINNIPQSQKQSNKKKSIVILPLNVSPRRVVLASLVMYRASSHFSPWNHDFDEL